MITRHRKSTRRLQRAYLAILGGAASLAVLGGIFAATVAEPSSAAPNAAPSNVTEPRVTGTPRVGQVLRTSRGTWSGTEPISYEFRWFRWHRRRARRRLGLPAHLERERQHVSASRGRCGLQDPLAGHREERRRARTPRPRTRPGSSSRLDRRTRRSRRSPGPPPSATSSRRTVASGPVTSRSRTRSPGCAAAPQGDNCSEIQGRRTPSTRCRDADRGRTIRVRVSARNDRGTTSAISNPTASSVAHDASSSSAALPVGSLEAAGDRLVVSQVRFKPEPGDEPYGPDHRSRPRDRARWAARERRAGVHARDSESRPGPDGVDPGRRVGTLTLVPNQQFPQPRSGFNVQFFVKASKPGDPGLGGIAGFRLVQVRLAG